MRTRSWSVILAIIVVGSLFAVAMWYSFFGPKRYYLKHQCDLQRSDCVIREQSRVFKIKIDSRPIKVKTPPIISVETVGSEIKEVNLKIVGLSMVMMPIETKLQKQDNLFQARMIFDICTEKVMKWRVMLSMQEGNNIYFTQFDFETVQS